MCHISTQQIAADGLVVANALTDIANQPGISPDVKAALLAAADGLVKATTNWTTGSSRAIFDDAMKAVTVAMSEIPLTAPYAVFVEIAQTAIDLLWANIDNITPSSATISAPSVKAVLAQHELNVAAAPSPWHDRVKLEHRLLESYLAISGADMERPAQTAAHAWDEETMSPADEIRFLESQVLYLKDEELKALTRGDRADEAACSRQRQYCDKRAQFIKGLAALQ